MNRHREEKNWLEWTVFAAGLLLMGALLGYLVYDAVTASSGPARVEVRLGEPEQRSEHYAVPVTVTNRGLETAEMVHVEVTLEWGDGQSEKAEFQVQFLPRGATRKGTVTFATDPAKGRLTPRVLGYQRP